MVRALVGRLTRPLFRAGGGAREIPLFETASLGMTDGGMGNIPKLGATPDSPSIGLVILLL
jgi:hypothetical protein